MANAKDSGQIKIGEFTVNRMGFGAMRITGEGVWGPPKDVEVAKAVLKKAVELGINFIDTADGLRPRSVGEPDPRRTLSLRWYRDCDQGRTDTPRSGHLDAGL